MRLVICLLCCLFALNTFGQIKDTRAELKIHGYVTGISVSPDETLWLTTAAGKTYYLKNIDSLWHLGRPFFSSSPDKISPSLEEISFFNKDTAIMTGYISYWKPNLNHSGYYLSWNAGKNWSLQNYGGNSWIYSAFTDKQGNAWLGGMNKELYYSSDFGQSWKTLNIPYEESDLTYGITMLNSNEGILFSANNEILSTSDNWKTTKPIPSPVISDSFKIKDNNNSSKFYYKIQFWNNYIVFSQYNQVYYTDKDEIKWQSMPLNVKYFDVDIVTKNLFAISDSLKVIEFKTPNDYQFLLKNSISSPPVDLEAFNGSLYILSNLNEIHKVNNQGIKTAMPYTRDQKISKPKKVVYGDNLIWGITDNDNHIYLCDKNDSNWYRENKVDFNIAEITLVNDSTAILWNGMTENYIYSLKEHTAKSFTQELPLESFLSSPIKNIKIEITNVKGNIITPNEVKFKKFIKHLYKAPYSRDYTHKQNTSKIYKNKINTTELTAILQEININPSAIPSFRDFNFNDSDITRYYSLVEERINNKNDVVFPMEKNIDKDFYYSVPPLLDTLDNSIIISILNQKIINYSTSFIRYEIEMTNKNGDTLNILSKLYKDVLPWNIPWIFEYKGQYFSCYNLKFAQFAVSTISTKYKPLYEPNNSRLILSVAEYLWRNR